MHRRSFATACITTLALAVVLVTAAVADDGPVGHDWPSWRGIHNTGVSHQTGLISEWTPGGAHQLWRSDYTGRSTPVVMNGRVFVIGRVGENEAMQERVTCFDAESGKQLWDYRYNLYMTTVPFNRLGWANMTGDPETGYVYSVGTGGMLHCFDPDGTIVWERSLIEDFGIRTGYGGRTTSAVIDEERVIVGFVTSGWGDQKPMKHRHFALDKRTGEVIWMATPSEVFRMPNIYTVPAIAVIDGQRLMIAGNADGLVYAMKARTGEKVWQFRLSKRGLNSSVLVDGYRVYAAHSEENIDEATMGRIVCIDGRGSGDITATNELWRYPAEIGYTSPLLHDGRIYYLDNAANLICLDAETGAHYWEHSLGTVGKSSPVWADGKIYVTETNGHFLILDPGDTSCVTLDKDELSMPNGRYAEIYSSPAIAYQRIYFTTEEGVYCLGDPSIPFEAPPSRALTLDEPAPDPNAAVAHIQVVPAETVLRSGEKAEFVARAFDANGRFLKRVAANWSLKGFPGDGGSAETFTLTAGESAAAGAVSASADGVTGTARVRVFPQLPWKITFDDYEDGANPDWWIGAGSARSPGGKFVVATLEGEKVLAKPRAERGIQRHTAIIGPSTMSGYVLQADVRDQKVKRRRSDIGLISHGYTMDLMGKTQRLELRSWLAEYRIKETIDFAWDPDVWYTMKLDVELHDDKAVVRGKVWPRGEAEPGDWTIVVEDPHPIRAGSPALIGVSNTEHYYDNIVVAPR